MFSQIDAAKVSSNRQLLAGEKLTAFLEPESARAVSLLDIQAPFGQKDP
jgi:hypothetical protein